MEVAAVKIMSKLKDNRGEAMITPAVCVMISVLFLLLLSHFIYIYSMILGISDYVQQAVLQTAASNAFNAYNGVREGNSTAHIYTGNGQWSEMVSTAELQTRLKEMLQMNRQGNRLYKEKDGVLRYVISDIDTRCTNVDVASSGNSIKLTFKTSVVAELPMYFMGVHITVKKPISLMSYYTPLF